MSFNIPEGMHVHAGAFHADDVFCVAFMQMLHQMVLNCKVRSDVDATVTDYRFKLTRISNIRDANQGWLMADIGLGEFDHHQVEQEYRDPETKVFPYAAFGKLVRHYWPVIFTEAEYQAFDNMLVKWLDRHDCTGKIDESGTPNTLSMSIKAFSPVSPVEDTGVDAMNAAFMEAVSFAAPLVARYIERAKATVVASELAHDLAINADPETKAIVMERYIPVGSSREVQDSCANWLVYPSLRNPEVTQVFSILKDGANKQLIPQEIRDAYQLYPEQNIYEMTFCHPAGFTAGFKSKKAALRFLRILAGF